MGSKCSKEGARYNTDILPPPRKKSLRDTHDSLPINNAPTEIVKMSFKATYSGQTRIASGYSLDEIKLSVSNKFKLQNGTFSLSLERQGHIKMLNRESDLQDIMR